MSIKVSLSLLSQEIQNKISKDLKLKLEEKRQSYYAQKYIYPYEVFQETGEEGMQLLVW